MIKHKALLLSLLSSIAFLIFIFFQWVIIDKITPFLFMPLTIIVWILFLFLSIKALIAFYKKRSLSTLFPLTIYAITLLSALFIPFTTLWIKRYFQLYKNEREAVIRDINSNKFKTHHLQSFTHINLDHKYPYLSMGGNQIAIQEHGGLKYIFFYTYRGILDNYSGFLYVPKGGDPSYYSDLNESHSTQIIPLAPHWYFVSHH